MKKRFLSQTPNALTSAIAKDADDRKLAKVSGNLFQYGLSCRALLRPHKKKNSPPSDRIEDRGVSLPHGLAQKNDTVASFAYVLLVCVDNWLIGLSKAPPWPTGWSPPCKRWFICLMLSFGWFDRTKKRYTGSFSKQHWQDFFIICVRKRKKKNFRYSTFAFPPHLRSSG